MKPYRFASPILLLLIAGLISCSMQQEISLDKSGSGSVHLDIQLAGYLTEVVTQVQNLLDPDNPRPADSPFFDTEAIRADINKREDIVLRSLDSPDRNSLSASFDFTDINGLYQEAVEKSGDRLIGMETRGDLHELKVILSRETVEALLNGNPALNNPLVENFGPASTRGMTETDYLDMMGYALGAESRQGIIESSLSLLIRVDGIIISQNGGTPVGDSAVRFEVPLLPILMLNNPIEYSLQYR